jgi:hypothetical protein
MVSSPRVAVCVVALSAAAPSAYVVALGGAPQFTTGLVSRTLEAEINACERACLRRLADDYLDALAKHDPRRLPLSADVKFTENGMVLQLGEGFWRTAGEPGSHRVYVIDPDSGGIAVQSVVHEGGADVVLLLRLKIGDQRIREIETLVVRKADGRDFDPPKLDSLEPLDVAVPQASRNTREGLIRIADAYYTALHTQGTSEYRRAPFADGANRYENGELTTNVASAPRGSVISLSASEQFDRGMFRGRNVGDRRYPVVDVENGTVLGIVTFRPSPTSTVLLLSEVFKISGGKLREIRAVQLNRPPGSPTGWNPLQ